MVVVEFLIEQIIVLKYQLFNEGNEMKKLMLLAVLLAWLLVQGCSSFDLRNPISGRRYQMRSTDGQDANWDKPLDKEI